MSEDDKQVFEKGRPYIVAILAVLFRLRDGPGVQKEIYFDHADEWVKEFERRNA